MQILEEKNITLAEAKAILEKKEQEKVAAQKELGYEQKVTLEHLRKFVRLSPETTEKAKKELEALGVLKDYQISALIDVLPKNEEEVNMLFVKERIGLEKEQVGKILSILNSIRPAEKVK